MALGIHINAGAPALLGVGIDEHLARSDLNVFREVAGGGGPVMDGQAGGGVEKRDVAEK